MLLTLTSASSTPSSASSAEALAPVSERCSVSILPLLFLLAGTGSRRGVSAQGAYGRVLRTDVDSALSDHGAVSLVDSASDLLEVVGVRDDLVSGEDVLFIAGFWLAFRSPYRKKNIFCRFFPPPPKMAGYRIHLARVPLQGHRYVV